MTDNHHVSRLQKVHCCCHDEPVRRCLHGGTDVQKRWGIPPDFHSPGTHLWCQSNQRSNAGVLLPILGRVIVNLQPSRPHYHNVDRFGIQSGQWVLGRKPWSWVCWASVGGLLFVLCPSYKLVLGYYKSIQVHSLYIHMFKTKSKSSNFLLISHVRRY